MGWHRTQICAGCLLCRRLIGGDSVSNATSPSTHVPTSLPGETSSGSASDDRSETAPEGDSRRQLSLDTIFGALKNARRRHVLTYLRQTDEPLEIGELAERIAADENDKSVSEITYSERKRVYVALYQCHLPQLDDAGLVSYDKSRGSVALQEDAAQLEPYLDGSATTRRWYRYYAAIVGAGALVLGGVWLLGLSTVAIQLALVGLLVTTAACTAAHAWSATEIG